LKSIKKHKEYSAGHAQSEVPPHSIVVCLSPLTSLIPDQVQLFTKRGLEVVYIKGKDLDGKKSIAKIPTTYCTESLLVHRDLFTCSIISENLSGIIVDEAHLISKW